MSEKSCDGTAAALRSGSTVPSSTFLRPSEIAAEGASQTGEHNPQQGGSSDATGEAATPVSGIGAVLKGHLHEREELCRRLEGLPAEAAAELPALQRAWDEAPPVPSEYLEILERRFAAAAVDFKRRVDEREAAGKRRAEALTLLQGNQVRLAEWETAAEILPQRKNIEEIYQQSRAAAAAIDDGAVLLQPLEELYRRLQQRWEAEQQAEAELFHNLRQCCERLEELAKGDPESGKEEKQQLEKRFQQLLPAAEQCDRPAASALQHRVQKALKVFSASLHQLYQARDLERWEHYTLKLDICRELEQLVDCPDKDLPLAAKRQKALRERWQELGAVPHEKADELWAGFRGLNSRLQARLNEYFDRLEKERNASDELKKSLVEQAEQLAHSTKWEKSAELLKALQQQWRMAGPGHRALDQQLYQKFRTACDTFFTARNDFYQERRAVYTAAAEQKEQFCREAEQLSQLPPREGRQRADELRRRWQETPSAGRTDQELYLRFKAALDAFFNGRRSAIQDGIGRKEQNLKSLEELLAHLENPAVTDDLAALRRRCRELEQEWETGGELPHAVYIEFEQRRRWLLDKIQQSLPKFRLRQLLQEMVVRAAQEEQLARWLATAGPKEWPAGLEAHADWRATPTGRWLLAQTEAVGKYSGWEEFQKHNQAVKESCCGKLERTTGPAEKTAVRIDLDLAAELKRAMESHFDAPPSEEIPAENLEDTVREFLACGLGGVENDALNRRFLTALRNAIDGTAR